jgi:hypothetical protein
LTVRISLKSSVLYLSLKVKITAEDPQNSPENSAVVTVRHMYAAAVTVTSDYRGSTSATSKGSTRGEQAMYI